MVSRTRFDIRQHGRTILIVLGGFAVLNIAGFLLLVRPQLLDANALSGANNPRIEALRAKQDRVIELEAFVEALGQAQVDLKTLQEDVLATREQRMVAVQSEIHDLCRKFRIDLELVSYEFGELSAEALEFQRMEVPLTGGYGELRGFLQAVESSEKFIVVEKVVLGQAKDGGVMLDLKITLSTFFDSPVLRQKRTGASRRRRGKA
jgi:Tfp pilus assembly protein PilO